MGQSMKNWELMIVDDGSTDDTESVVRQFVKSDSRIHYLHQKNAGQASARNKGFEEARGEYIAFLDSDDIYLSENLEKKAKILDSDKGILIVNGFSWMVDYTKKIFLGYASYSPSNWMVRRDFLKAGGGFDPKERNIEDTAIRIRAMNFFNNPQIESTILEPLTVYFLHGAQVSRAANKEPVIFGDRVELLAKNLHPEKEKVYEHFAPEIFSRIGNFYCLSGRMKEGRDLFKKSIAEKGNLFTICLFPATYGGMQIYRTWEGLLRFLQKQIIWKLQLARARRRYNSSFILAKNMINTLEA